MARQEDAKERANKSQLSSEVYSFDFAIALPKTWQDPRAIRICDSLHIVMNFEHDI